MPLKTDLKRRISEDYEIAVDGGIVLMKSTRVCSVDTLPLEDVDTYAELSYLRKSEILRIYYRFRELWEEEVTANLHQRFEKSRILQVFPELSYNPFIDRIFHVFSSLKDEKMSFEDVLDLASAFSEDCPIDTKAQWAFLMFDFDGDELLSQNDISEVVKRLTREGADPSDREDHMLTDEEIMKAAEIVFNGIVLCHSEGITCMEFTNEVKKIPEFGFAFRIKFL